ncbi:unnamed protein product [Rhodiola kirilowii]
MADLSSPFGVALKHGPKATCLSFAFNPCLWFMTYAFGSDLLTRFESGGTKRNQDLVLGSKSYGRFLSNRKMNSTEEEDGDLGSTGPLSSPGRCVKEGSS